MLRTLLFLAVDNISVSTERKDPIMKSDMKHRSPSRVAEKKTSILSRFFVLLLIAMMIFLLLLPAGSGRSVSAAEAVEARGHNVIKVTTAEDFDLGTKEALAPSPIGNGALTLQEGSLEGSFVSAEYLVDDFQDMVGSWNAYIPHGAYIEVMARAYTDKTEDGEDNPAWTDWFSWGSYGMYMKRGSKSDEIDTFSPGGRISKAQFKAILHRETGEGQAPLLRQMTFSIRGGDANPVYAESSITLPDKVSIKAPAYAQGIRDPEIGSSICSPTTMSVLLNSRNPDLELKPEELALSLQDFNYGFGNWSFSTSVAGLYGYEAYAAYASKEILMQELANGRSVGLSVRYSSKPDGLYPYLEGAYSDTGGHLIAIVGYEYEGGIKDDDHLYFLSADSYSPNDATAFHRYKWTQLDKAWKGRLAYFVSSSPEAGAPVSGVERHEASLVKDGENLYAVEADGTKLDLTDFTQGKTTTLGRGVLAYTVEGFLTDHSEASPASVVYPDRLQVGANQTFYYTGISTTSEGKIAWNPEDILFRLGVPTGESRTLTLFLFTNDGQSYKAEIKAVSAEGETEDMSVFDEEKIKGNFKETDLSGGYIREDAVRVNGSLSLSDKAGQERAKGAFLSPIYSNEWAPEYMMATINAYTPGASHVELQVRAVTRKSGGAWSPWMSWGKFGSGIRSGSDPSGDQHIKLNTDVLMAKGKSAEAFIDKWQFRVLMEGDEQGNKPEVFDLSCTFKKDPYDPAEGLYTGQTKATDLPEEASISVTPMTSYGHASGLEGWRFENLMTMMINAKGGDALYEEVALNGYDFNGGWGNWAFTPFKAGLFGNRSYTQYAATTTMIQQCLADGNPVGLFVNSKYIPTTNTAGNRQILVYAYKTGEDGNVEFSYICPCGDQKELAEGAVLNTCSAQDLAKAIAENSSGSVRGAMYVVKVKEKPASVERRPIGGLYEAETGKISLYDKQGPISLPEKFGTKESMTEESGGGVAMYLYEKDRKQDQPLAANDFHYDLTLTEEGGLALSEEAKKAVDDGDILTLYLVQNNGLTYTLRLMNAENLGRLKEETIQNLEDQLAAGAGDEEAKAAAGTILAMYRAKIKAARSPYEVDTLYQAACEEWEQWKNADKPSPSDEPAVKPTQPGVSTGDNGVRTIAKWFIIALGAALAILVLLLIKKKRGSR